MQNTVPFRKHILIAEDDPDIGNLIQFHLQRRGFRTTAMVDGREVLQKMFDLTPDLLILDLMLPNLHGFEICRLARSVLKLNRLPIIILTALASDEDRRKGLRMGANAYLTKPFLVKDLIGHVECHLESRGAPPRRSVSAGDMFLSREPRPRRS